MSCASGVGVAAYLATQPSMSIWRGHGVAVRTAVDSSVLLDVIVNDSSFADRSEVALRRVASEGSLIVCECVVAEIRRKASPGPGPPGDYRQVPFAVYSAAVGSVTVPGWPMAAMAARCK